MRRPGIGRVVVLMPSGFTLLNLCMGMLAIIHAFRDDLGNAGLFVVIGGVADAFDGRVARATRTGSRFGEELDSLADFITFGIAPAMIMYTSVLKNEGLHWLWAFIFIAAAAIRLAKFNVEQAGRQKTHFYGLPSPAAGMTLATYYWFSQTDLYTQSWVGSLPWQTGLRVVMVVLAVLMMSNVQYPAVPAIGFRTLKGLASTALVAATIVGVIFYTREFFFPALVAYVAYGLIKTAVIGLLERRIALLPGPEIEVVDAPEQRERERDRERRTLDEPGRTSGRPRRRKRRRSTGGGGGGGAQSRGDAQPQSTTTEHVDPRREGGGARGDKRGYRGNDSEPETR